MTYFLGKTKINVFKKKERHCQKAIYFESFSLRKLYNHRKQQHPMAKEKSTTATTTAAVAATSVQKEIKTTKDLFSKRLFKAPKTEGVTKKKSSSSTSPTSNALVRRATLAKRRQKIRFYQQSKYLPTSPNTFKKALCQTWGILNAEGQITTGMDFPAIDEQDYVKQENEKLNRILSGFSITKEALHALHGLHVMYIGEVLKTAQLISQNMGRITVKTNILDLAEHMVREKMGPTWNMCLEKKTETTDTDTDTDTETPPFVCGTV